MAGGPNWFSVHISPPWVPRFPKWMHGECMNKTKLSFIPLFLMHGSLYHDISENTKYKYQIHKYQILVFLH